MEDLVKRCGTCGHTNPHKWAVNTRRISGGYYQRKCRKCQNEDQRNSIGNQYRSYVKGAARRNYAFELSMEEFIELIFSPCYYCGETGDVHKSHRNGVDRVDNSKGYVKGNVVSCCWNCNLLKKSVSVNIARKIVEFVDNR
jgi:hypothetical protein